MRYFESEFFYEKKVYFLIHALHDFEIMLDDAKANLELRKLERTH